MIDWNTDRQKTIFNSDTFGEVLVEVSAKSIVILDFFDRKSYQKIAVELLNTSEYDSKLVFYDGCMMYNVNNT